MTKTHNWVEWTAPSVSLSQTKVYDIILNDRPQMQNDTENEIGRSLFPFIYKCINRLRKTTIPEDAVLGNKDSINFS